MTDARNFIKSMEVTKFHGMKAALDRLNILRLTDSTDKQFIYVFRDNSALLLNKDTYRILKNN